MLVMMKPCYIRVTKQYNTKGFYNSGPQKFPCLMKPCYISARYSESPLYIHVLYNLYYGKAEIFYMLEVFSIKMVQ